MTREDRNLPCAMAASIWNYVNTYAQGTPYNRLAAAPDCLRGSQLMPETAVDEMQTILWTRDLSKVDPREIEGCEDLLDAYFLMVLALFPLPKVSVFSTKNNGVAHHQQDQKDMKAKG